MDVYSLYPPNTLSLSDDVVGNVVQRARPRRASYIVSEPDTNSTTRPCLSRPPSSKETADPPTPAEQCHSIDKKQNATLKLLLKRMDRRREVCRVNQARYVERQRKIVTDLEEGIQKLQEEVKELEIQHHSACTSVPTHNTVWGVVRNTSFSSDAALNRPPKRYTRLL